MRTRVHRAVIWHGGYAFAAASIIVAAVLLLPLRSLLQLPAIMLLFVPLITGVARVSGTRPAGAAAVIAFLVLDFFYVPPYNHLAVDSLPAWLALSVFLIVALVTGSQTGQLRERERAAVQRQEELELLNGLSFEIASARSPEEVARFVVEQVVAIGAERAAVYLPGEAGLAPHCEADAGRPRPSSGEDAFVHWVTRSGSAIGLTSDGEADVGRIASVSAEAAVPGVAAEGVYIPLRTADSLEGVLHAVPPADGEPRVDPSLLASVANLVAASFERQRLEEEAARAAVLREAERFKSTLVSSVSHELKTPLAAATARVTGLLEEGAADGERVRTELEEVSGDLTRLNASIGDLLDLSRLESEEWRPKSEMQEVGDILAAALSRLPVRDRDRVRFSLASSAPFVTGDFGQLVRAIVNLMENALAYSPAGSSVAVTSVARGREILIAVEDRGGGVADGEKQVVFDKFYRGRASALAPGGTGLGLAIASEIVRSHGGRLWVEDAVPSGARFVMSLPAGGWADRR